MQFYEVHVVNTVATDSTVSFAVYPLGLGVADELKVGVFAEEGRDLLGAQVDQVAVVSVVIVRASKHGYFFMIDQCH